MRRVLLAAFLWLFEAGAVQAAGQTFNDWEVVCSNLRACSAFGYPAEAAPSGQAYLRIDRDGAPGAAPRVSVSIVRHAAVRPSPWRVSVDGHAVPGLGAAPTTILRRASGNMVIQRAVLTPAQGAALIAAIRNGRALTFGTATVSLTGSAAALLYVDDQQHRVGTVTALLRPGGAPASSIPPVPAPPVVRRAAAVSQAGRPAATPAPVMAALASECDPDQAHMSQVIARLAPGRMLFGVVCQWDPRSAHYKLRVADEQGRGPAEPPTVVPPGLTADDAAVGDLDNPRYDPATRILSSRGYADDTFGCGYASTWAWTGNAFVPLTQRGVEGCHGIPEDEWPSEYVARIQ